LKKSLGVLEVEKNSPGVFLYYEEMIQSSSLLKMSGDMEPKKAYREMTVVKHKIAVGST
jgi:hypothetical protein